MEQKISHRHEVAPSKPAPVESKTTEDLWLQPGMPAPWFRAATVDNPNFNFDTVAGRRVILSFVGNMEGDALRALLMKVRAVYPLLRSAQCVFLAVSTSEDDLHAEAFKEVLPHCPMFFDRDTKVSRLYGLCEDNRRGRAVSYLLDERLRVMEVVPWVDTPEQHIERLLRHLQELPDLPAEKVSEIPAPVLVVPNVFEPGLCRALIDYYKREGGQESGFMRDVNGKTKLVHDPMHKRRRDRAIDDEGLREACRSRIRDCLLPEVAKAFQFRATRIERYLVACYEASESGHFRAHRDNTTLGTAHRKFAVSMNLNTGEYKGGLLRFPEFGRHLYQAPAGGALVFSCSLLHEATRVAEGCRYAFLPFLYDEESAKTRDRNKIFLIDPR